MYLCTVCFSEIKQKNGFLFCISLNLHYLCSRFSVVLVKGCSRVWAEMIPSKPDTDNAGVGIIE